MASFESNTNATMHGNNTLTSAYNNDGFGTQEMKATIGAVLMILYASSILFHTLGSYLQIRLYREGKDSVHLIYLINLGLTEGLGCTLGFFFLHIPKFFDLSPSKNSTYGEVHKYICVVLYTLPLIYYTNFIYITIDKLLYITLGIKYHLYCTQKRTTRLILGTWLIGLCLWVTMSLATFIKGKRYDEPFSWYFNPTLDFLFLGTAIVCYSVIFKEYKNTRTSPVPLNNDCSKKKESNFKVFMNSRFYVSGLLILTFLVLVVIPDVVYLFYTVILNNESRLFDAIVLIFFLLSYLNDAFIYIFMQPDVRKLLRKILVQFVSRK